jgi:hypothetical protein
MGGKRSPRPCMTDDWQARDGHLKKWLERNAAVMAAGVSVTSPALGANEAMLILMPSLLSPRCPSYSHRLSASILNPKSRRSPVLRYTVAPVLPPVAMLLLTLPCALLLSLSPKVPYGLLLRPTGALILCWGRKGWPVFLRQDR